MKINHYYSLIAVAIMANTATAATTIERSDNNTATASAPINDDAEKTPSLERIIVTGSRIPESIIEVPASVTVVSAEKIQQEMLVTNELQSLLALQVPGMGAQSGSISNSGQSLRGRAALIMIDGLPQSTPLRNGKLGLRTIDPSVIARIEVIKGATSIYGKGAAGGIINYITKKASSDKKLAGKVALSSSFSTVKFDDSLGERYDLSVNGTVNKFDYVLSAVVDNNGVIRDAEGDALGLKYGLSNFESKNLFSKFNYYLNDNRSLQLTYNYFEGQQNSDYYPVNGNINNGIKSHAIKNIDHLDVPGDPQGPRGNHNIKLQYKDIELTENTDFTADAYWQRIENVFFYATKFKDSSLGLTGGQSLIKSEKKGLRLNFNSEFSFNNLEANLIYGADILNDKTAQPLVDGRTWVPEMDMNNLAAYLQSKIVFANNWVLKAGVRQEAIDVSVDDFQTLMICKKSCTSSKNVEGGKLKYHATTYNIGLRYAADEMFSPFISYSEGFDISDLGRLLRETNAPDLATISTEASLVKNSELGFSSQLDGIHLEMAAFYSTSNLGSRLVEFADTGTFRMQRSPQKIWGYEAAVDMVINQQLDAGVTYSWSEGKDRDDNSYLDAGSINPPKFTAYVNYKANEKLALALSYLSVQSRKRFALVKGKYGGRTGPVSAYNVVNASANYNWDAQLSFSLGIENLFNNDYFPHVSQSYSYTGYNVKGKGRTAKISMAYQF